MSLKNFEEFKAALISDLQSCAQERGGCLKVEEVSKYNRVLTGVSFCKGDDGVAVCPVLYVEDAYKDYTHGLEYQEIITRILQLYFEKPGDDIENVVKELMEVFSDREALLQKVLCCFVKESGNETFVKQYVTVESPLEGLRLYFYIPGVMSKDGEEVSFSAAVNTTAVEKVGVSVEELYEAALKNIKEASAMYPMELIMLSELGIVELPASSVLSKSRGMCIA